MAELGSGSTPRSDYPGIIDTNTVNEVDSPSASKTLITAAKIEDGYSAILNIQTELGTDPAGTLTDVKTFLQTQHNTNGTHKASTFSGAITWQTDNTYDIGASGTTRPRDLYLGGTLKSGTVALARMKVDEQSASHATAYTTTQQVLATTASMNVVTGDRVMVFWEATVTAGASGTLICTQLRGTSGAGAAGTWIRPGGTTMTGDFTVDFTAVGGAVETNRSGATYMLITASGTLAVSILGFTGGANAGSSSGQLMVLVLRGT